MLAEKRREGRRILFEGAQGALLDIDFGTYPYVTSSNTLAGMAATGTGMGPGAVGFVLGIVKAYTTRVGEGPFPAELTDAVGQRLGERGHEFGTVTGRKRRCGWFDAVLVRQTCTTSGVTGIALTKLDVLDGFDELKICTGYELDGERLDHLPTAAAQQARVTPVYETMEGWSETTAGARSWAELPAQAIKYVRRIEELIGCPVALLSTSPERDDTILVTDPVRGMSRRWRARRRLVASLVLAVRVADLHRPGALAGQPLRPTVRPGRVPDLLRLGIAWALPLRAIFRSVARPRRRPMARRPIGSE